MLGNQGGSGLSRHQFLPASSTSLPANGEAAMYRIPSAIHVPRDSAMPKGSHRKLWAGSLIALGAANIVDAQSSWGKQEANSALAGPQGSFAARGAVMKTGINSCLLLSQ